jgi:hypothetical protein
MLNYKNMENKNLKFPYNFAINGGGDYSHSISMYEFFESLGAKNIADIDCFTFATDSAKYFYLTPDGNLEWGTRIDSEVLKRLTFVHLHEYRQFESYIKNIGE